MMNRVASPAGNPLLPRAVALLLLVALGVLAARVTWQVVAPDVRPAVTQAIVAVPVTPASSGALESPLAAIADLPLFGVLGVRTAPPPAAAPETRLRLRLVGLAAGDTPGKGHAMIAESGSPERLYAVGDMIGGQARLHEVHADRVILERGGSLETLRLPRSDAASTPASVASAPARAAPGAELPRVQRSEWLDDPEKLLQSVQARPVIRDGVLYGLEVRPVRNARQFQQAGLRPGDVITSVNGMPLAAIEAPENLFEELAAQSQIEIVVDRGGEALPLTIQLID
jgi:general secretion pathway protein C